jgi:mono/diheme cytochrome c family protein
VNEHEQASHGPADKQTGPLLYLLLLSACLVCCGCSYFAKAQRSEEQQVAQGRALYEANGCATCHGPEGHGDGPVAKAAHSSPRDLRDATSFVNGYGVDRIARTLQYGLADGNQIMPAYAHLSANDRTLLAVFIRSLHADSKKEQEK